MTPHLRSISAKLHSLVLALCGSFAVASAQTEPLKLPPISDGPFKPTWESLANYQTPEWFRDAKFGIWAHWGPQCEPERGDWYARNMYVQGTGQYRTHLAKYGHPSTHGFKDIIHEWKAERFDPYPRAGRGACARLSTVSRGCNFEIRL